jgi:hypothetical protein
MTRISQIAILALFITMALGMSLHSARRLEAGPVKNVPAPSVSPSESTSISPTPSPTASPATGPSPVPGTIASISDLVAAMDKAFSSIVDYSFIGYIKVDKGSIVADYRCVRPRTVRSEILEGKGKGAVVLYVPDQREDSVKVKSGSFRVWRNIKKLKIDNTPLVESLLDYILKMMKESKNVTYRGRVTLVAQVGGAIDVTLNPVPGTAPSVTPTPLTSPVSPSPSPTAFVSPSVPSPTPSPSPGPVRSPSSASPSASPSPVQSGAPEYHEVFKSGEKEEVSKKSPWLEPHTITKECYLVEIRGDEFSDIVALDTQNLWCAYAKRMKGDQLIFEAVVSDIRTNTGPKMDL